DAQRGKPPQLLEGRKQVLLVETELRLFPAEIHLDEHAQGLAELGGGVLELHAELGGVDGVDAVEDRGRLARLVALQMAHEMEARALAAQVLERRGLRLRLL